MESPRKVKLNYYEYGDTLWIHILPERQSLESMTEYDFYIRYDQQNIHEIVGFKILDFSHFISHIDEKGVLPEISMRFDSPELNLKSVSLRELINKAYFKFVRNRKPELQKIVV